VPTKRNDQKLRDRKDRIWAEFENGGNARGFGAQWAAFSRASVFPTLAAGLEGAELVRVRSPSSIV
jgi:hypothetical protein